MNTVIIDGKAIAQYMLAQAKIKLQEKSITPKLLIIQVGNDASSTQYIAIKKKRAEEVGIKVNIVAIQEAENSRVQDLIQETISKYSDSVDGVMIQLPLPNSVNTVETLALIPPHLDVDGLLLEKSLYNTAVAGAVLKIMQSQKNITRTSPTLIIGDSLYVGNSILVALKKADYEYVTCMNENTPHKQQHLRKAEVVISCVGKPHIYNVKQLHKGATLIDVGTSKDENGIIVGDFDVTRAQGYLSAYTPVPGGVGPVTVAMLLLNLVDNALKRR